MLVMVVLPLVEMAVMHLQIMALVAVEVVQHLLLLVMAGMAVLAS